MEKRLLKLLMKREYFLKAKKYLLRLKLEQPIGPIVHSILSLYEKHNPEEISLADLQTFHLDANQALTEAAKAMLAEFFADLAKEEMPNPDIAQDVIESCYRREIARQCAEASINVMHGKSKELSDVERVLLEYKNENLGNSDETPVNPDLSYLLKANENNAKWKFNLTSLHHQLPGIGPGTFTIVAGRIEMGKTALWNSWCAGPEGFAWQGAKINVYKNEEKGERDYLRLYSAASGMCEEEIRAKQKLAEELFDPIRGRINIYNAAGWGFDAIDRTIDRDDPDIIIVDMLDKVFLDGEFDANHQRLKEIYILARQRAIIRDKALIGFSQLSAEAHDRLDTDMSMLEGSKTGKAAEADVIICMGAREAMPGMRQLNLCKNKISGSHTPVMVKIQPEISRYTE